MSYGFSSHHQYILAFSVTISDIVACHEEQIITNNNQLDIDDCPGGNNLDEEGEAMVEKAV